MAKIFLICPVRSITEEEKQAIGYYVKSLEDAGHEVHWPPRDTKQDDPIGLRICTDNRKAIQFSDEIHIWYNPASQGSLFDFGMAFAMRKKIVLANPDMVKPTDGKKGFNNVLLALTENDIPLSAARQQRFYSNCSKAQTGAAIIKGGEIISRGHNSCEPEGCSRDAKIEVCPRVSLPTAVGYEMCHIIHAEVAVCLNIRPDRPLEHYALCESHITPTKELIRRLFSRKELERLSGSTLILSGHYYPCDNCKIFAELCGVKEIVIDELLAGIMKNYYRRDSC